MYVTRSAALLGLASALDAVFEEALSLLPEMVDAAKDGDALADCDQGLFDAVVDALSPRRDTSLFRAAMAAMRVVEGGEPHTLVLGRIDDGAFVPVEQEIFERLALDDTESRRIEGFISSAMTYSSPRSADVLARHRRMAASNAQAIAIRASYLAHFARFAASRVEAETGSIFTDGPDPAAAERHQCAWLDDMMRLSRVFADPTEAITLVAELALPSVPMAIGRPLEAEPASVSRLDPFPAFVGRMAAAVANARDAGYGQVG